MNAEDKKWYEEAWNVVRVAKRKAKSMSPEDLVVYKQETARELDAIFAETTLREEIAKDRVKRAGKKEESELKKKYKALQEEVEKLEAENSAILELEQSRSPHIITPSTSLGNSEAIAMGILSDWHIEENVRPESVNGKNAYDTDRAKKRADRCFQKLVNLTRKEQQDVTINHMIVGLLGDFISGNIHEELLENCEYHPHQASHV